MEDQFEDFFKDQKFDIEEPPKGHLMRFESKLYQQQKTTPFFKMWMGIAASVILCIGFYLGSLYPDNKPYSLSNVSDKMAEVETFFTTSIKYELKEVEKHRSIYNERLIEDALDQIEELEDDFKSFTKELTENNHKKEVIHSMITNYQKRLQILKDLLKKIEIQENKPTKFNHHDALI